MQPVDLNMQSKLRIDYIAYGVSVILVLFITSFQRFSAVCNFFTADGSNLS